MGRLVMELKPDQAAHLAPGVVRDMDFIVHGRTTHMGKMVPYYRRRLSKGTVKVYFRHAPS